MTEDLKHHIQPVLNRSPEKIIVHCGTNDLNSNKTPEEIAEEIISLCISIKRPSNLVMVSQLVPRNDQSKGKAVEVNTALVQKCNIEHIQSISHDNIDPTVHLNNSRLHTNHTGTTLMSKNFVNALRD